MATNENWGQDDEVLSTGEWGQDDEVLSAPVAAKPNVSMAESMGRGGGQGLTLGFGDEISGGSAAAIQTVANTFGISIPDARDLFMKGVLNISDFVTGSDKADKVNVRHFEPGTSASDAYLNERDDNRRLNDAAREAHPVAYTTSEIAGSIPTTLLAPEARLLKSGSTLAKVGNSALTGGYQGAIFGAGSSEADNVTDLAKDTAIGGALGSAFGAGGQLLGQGFKQVGKYAPETLKDIARFAARKAIGANKSLMRKLGVDKVDDVADFILDEPGFLSSNTDDMLEKVQNIKNVEGDNLSKLYATLDEAGKSKSPDEIVAKLEALKNSQYGHIAGGAEAKANSAIDQAIAYVKSAPVDANGNLSASSLWDVRRRIDANVNWADTARGIENKTLKQATGNLRDDLTDLANQGGAGDELLAANKRYSDASGAETVLKDKAAAEMGNNKVFTVGNILSSSIGGAGGLASGGPLGALAGIGGGMAVRKFGPSATAKTVNALSKSKAFKTLAEMEATGTTGNIFSKPVIGEAVEDEDPDNNYGSPTEDETQQFVQNVPENMQGKKFAVLNDYLNQTNGEYRKKLYDSQH